MTRTISTADPSDSPSLLRDYWRVVQRRKSLVVVAVLVAVAGSIALSVLQEPVYEAESRLLVEPRSTTPLSGDERSLNVQALDRAIQTEIEVLEAPGVRERVRTDLGLDRLPPTVSARPVGSTDIVRVSVRSADAQTAQALADAYADAYINLRREQAISDQVAISSEIQRRVDSVRADIEAIDSEVAATAEDERAARADQLEVQRSSLVSQLSVLEQRLSDLEVNSALTTGGASIVKRAGLPSDPVEPTPARSAVLAAIAGLLVGLGAAFLVDYLDDSVRSSADIESLTPIPPLAVVPIDTPPDNRPIAISRPTDYAVEAYRGLRTNVQFLGLDTPMKVVQVTSSLPGEGKTTTATNLAVVLAQAGRRVLLVDADLRKPCIAPMFAVPERPGLTDLLLGDPIELGTNELDEHLHVITAGTAPPNPSELLAGERTRTLIDALRQRYDHVVIDSPPVLPVSDPLALTGVADGVLVVAEAKRTSRRALGATLDRLARVEANVVGIVLNRASAGRGDDASYGYGYGNGYAYWRNPATSDRSHTSGSLGGEADTANASPPGTDQNLR